MIELRKVKEIWRFHSSNIILLIFCLLAIIVICKFKLFILSDSELVDLTSYNAIISGFLFTAISVLISALSNERVERLMKHKYLDKYYFSIIFSLVLSILAIIINLLYMFIDINVLVDCLQLLQKIVISLTLISSMIFIQAVYYIIKLLRKLFDN